MPGATGPGVSSRVSTMTGAPNTHVSTAPCSVVTTSLASPVSPVPQPPRPAKEAAIASTIHTLFVFIADLPLKWRHDDARFVVRGNNERDSGIRQSAI